VTRIRSALAERLAEIAAARPRRPDVAELHDERAAIRQFDGGTTRVAADLAALDDVLAMVTRGVR
jgi:hypothetical protein